MASKGVRLLLLLSWVAGPEVLSGKFSHWKAATGSKYTVHTVRRLLTGSGIPGMHIKMRIQNLSTLRQEPVGASWKPHFRQGLQNKVFEFVVSNGEPVRRTGQASGCL